MNLKFVYCLFLVSFLTASCKSPKEKLADDIKKGETELFNDSLGTLNNEKANSVLQDYLTYSEKYKEDTTSASYLFKAGDLANGLKRPMEAIEIFEKMRVTYPDYRRSAAALFMQGFIFETAIQDKEKAKEKYRLFINNYPEHALTPSAEASLNQLNANLSDEELIKQFEQGAK
jgi:TolA-binding protein